MSELEQIKSIVIANLILKNALSKVINKEYKILASQQSNIIKVGLNKYSIMQGKYIGAYLIISNSGQCYYIEGECECNNNNLKNLKCYVGEFVLCNKLMAEFVCEANIKVYNYVMLDTQVINKYENTRKNRSYSFGQK